MNANEVVWRTCSKGREYSNGEDFVVYYDIDSGDTHLLSGLALHILGMLEGDGLSREAVVDHLSREFENPEEIDLQALVRDTLTELANINLVAVY